jgi:protein tyrosine/serine phosphatase
MPFSHKNKYEIVLQTAKRVGALTEKLIGREKNTLSPENIKKITKSNNIKRKILQHTYRRFPTSNLTDRTLLSLSLYLLSPTLLIFFAASQQHRKGNDTLPYDTAY